MHDEHADLSLADYDLRAPLHLAAAEGKIECVKFLVEECHVPIDPLDRFNNTPLMEAYRHAQREVALYLLQIQGKQEGAQKLKTSHKQIVDLLISSINGNLEKLRG